MCVQACALNPLAHALCQPHHASHCRPLLLSHPNPTHPRRPAAKYAPWFRVPLKSARLAVKVISLLSEAERASRLSFADVIKRLAEEPEGSPVFISKNRDRVERFVVVHGQIFLNQIKAFPKQVCSSSSSRVLASMLNALHGVRMHLLQPLPLFCGSQPLIMCTVLSP